MGSRALGLWGSKAFGLLGSWALGLWGSGALGLLGSGALGLLGSGALGLLGFMKIIAFLHFGVQIKIFLAVRLIFFLSAPCGRPAPRENPPA